MIKELFLPPACRVLTNQWNSPTKMGCGNYIVLDEQHHREKKPNGEKSNCFKTASELQFLQLEPHKQIKYILIRKSGTLILKHGTRNQGPQSKNGTLTVT